MNLRTFGSVVMARPLFLPMWSPTMADFNGKFERYFTNYAIGQDARRPQDYPVILRIISNTKIIQIHVSNFGPRHFPASVAVDCSPYEIAVNVVDTKKL